MSDRIIYNIILAIFLVIFVFGWLQNKCVYCISLLVIKVRDTSTFNMAFLRLGKVNKYDKNKFL